MTQKDVTNLMYEKLENPIYLESQIMNSKEFSIFKSADDEIFIICVLANIGESYISENLTTINECYDWINQNQR
jgi:hypothetical protein